MAIFSGDHPGEGLKVKRPLSLAKIWPIISHNSETVQDRRSLIGMSHVGFRLALKSVILNDLERRTGPYFALFRRIRYSFRGPLCKSDWWHFMTYLWRELQLSTTDALCRSRKRSFLLNMLFNCVFAMNICHDHQQNVDYAMHGAQTPATRTGDKRVVARHPVTHCHVCSKASCQTMVQFVVPYAFEICSIRGLTVVDDADTCRSAQYSVPYVCSHYKLSSPLFRKRQGASWSGVGRSLLLYFLTPEELLQPPC